jgi:hypothetical protein
MCSPCHVVMRVFVVNRFSFIEGSVVSVAPISVLCE